MNKKTGCVAFYTDIDNVIEFGKDFFTDYNPNKKVLPKTFDIFDGKKTEAFDIFTKSLGVDIDTVEIEAEHWINRVNDGDVLKYTGDQYTVYVDLCVPSDFQIEALRIGVEFPLQDKEKVVYSINELLKSDKYFKIICNSDKASFIKDHKTAKKTHC